MLQKQKSQDLERSEMTGLLLCAQETEVNSKYDRLELEADELSHARERAGDR